MDHFNKIIQLLKQGKTYLPDEKIWEKVSAQLPPEKRPFFLPWWFIPGLLVALGTSGWLGYRIASSNLASPSSAGELSGGQNIGPSNETNHRDTIYIHDTLLLNAAQRPAIPWQENERLKKELAQLNRRLMNLNAELEDKRIQLRSTQTQLATSELNLSNLIRKNQSNDQQPNPAAGALSDQNKAEGADPNADQFRLTALAPGVLPGLSIYPDRQHILHGPPYMVHYTEPKLRPSYLPKAYRFGLQYGVGPIPLEHEIQNDREPSGGITLELILNKNLSLVSGAGLRHFSGKLGDHEDEYINVYPASPVTDPDLQFKELYVSKKYFEIPLMVKYALPLSESRLFRPYAAAGIYLTKSRGQEFTYEYVQGGSDVYVPVKIPASKLSLNTLGGLLGIEMNPIYHLSTFADFAFRYQYGLNENEYGFLHGVTFRIGASFEF